MSRTQRILYLNPGGEIGGAERVLLNVIEAVLNKKPETEAYLIAGSDGDLLTEARRLGAHARLIPMPEQVAQLGESQLKMQSLSAVLPRLAFDLMSTVPGAWRYVGQLSRATNEIAPTLIHSNGVKTHLFTRFIHAQRRPSIWHLHDFITSRPMTSRTLQLASSRLNGAIAVSEEVKLDALQLFPEIPIETIHNTVDTHHFRPEAGDPGLLDRLAGLKPAPPGTFRVGLVATYAKWKGQDIFLQAAQAIVKTNPDLPIRFYIVGSPIYRTTGSQFLRAELEQWVRDYGLSEHVGLIDHQAQIASVYHALDLFTHCSTEPEPFGMTIAEALACGRPVVFTNGASIRSLLTLDQDAIAIPPKDPVALARIILELSRDSERRKFLGENARRVAVSAFPSLGLGDKLWKFYQSVIPQ